MLYIRLSACNNSTSPVPCDPNPQNFFNTSMFMGRFMAFSLIILDPGLNPSEENPITYKVYEKSLWMLFNHKQQIVGQIFLGTYEINTDTSLLPFKVTQN